MTERYWTFLKKNDLKIVLSTHDNDVIYLGNASTGVTVSPFDILKCVGWCNCEI